MNNYSKLKTLLTDTSIACDNALNPIDMLNSCLDELMIELDNKPLTDELETLKNELHDAYMVLSSYSCIEHISKLIENTYDEVMKDEDDE